MSIIPSIFDVDRPEYRPLLHMFWRSGPIATLDKPCDSPFMVGSAQQYPWMFVSTHHTSYSAANLLPLLKVISGLAITGSITQFVKITVGRPRPDLIDRCQPPTGSVDPEFGSSTWHICTRTDLLRDGFRSFPSGHSSMSFAGLGFLSYYLAGKLHLFDKRGHTGKAWISLAPFSAAALVAISRTMDNRHHWQDVFIGSLLGTVMSYFAYRQYYPPLSSEMSHKPYSPRIKREREAILPIHHDNESSRSDTPMTQPPNRPNTLTRRYTDEPDSEGYEMAKTAKRPEPNTWKDGEGSDHDDGVHIGTSTGAGVGSSGLR
ncbi:hypothetical protein PQX77_004649 [Marasmius sp. AFHP31]|nr:hypothetical protein PQX77_004649 [Marasmius sp. AFHP31]